MNNVLRWAKTNPSALASIIVSFASIVFIAYIVLFAAGSKLEKIADDAKQNIQQIARLERTEIEYPSSDPNAPPETTTGVANPNVIKTLGELYGTLKGEFRKVLAAATKVNQGERPKMLLAEDVLPKPGSTSIRNDARQAYPLILQKMLGVDVSGGLQEIDERWPEIKSGEPLDPDQIIDALEANRENLTSANPSGVSAEEYEQYVSSQRKNLLSMMRNHAAGMEVYVASLDPSDADYPFRLRPLAQPGPPPADDELWESQMELWVISDIVTAIRGTNAREAPKYGLAEDDPATPEDETLPPAPFNLPIKRLVSIDVLNGYVGLHTLGAMSGGTTQSGFDAAVAPPKAGEDDSGTPTLFQLPEGTIPGKGNKALPDNFYFGPAGRASNLLYDVRHARLIVHIDYQRMPILLEQIAATNLMTVLSVQVRDVDEFEMFTEGYLYGENDTVEAEIIIETIWLRDWTKELMPESVQKYLGATEDEKRPK